MGKIRVPAETSSELVKSESVAEICDEHGATLGYFIPSNYGVGKPPEEFELPFSHEELELLRQSRSGRTLEEILQGLGLE